MTDQGQNNRRLTRAPVDFLVRVVFEDGRIIEGALRNVGVSGIFVDVAEGMGVKLESRCEVHIVLSEERQIEARGIIVRLEPSGFAIQFDAIDADGLVDLHNVVVYNAADPDEAIDEVDDSTDLGIQIYSETVDPNVPPAGS